MENNKISIRVAEFPFECVQFLHRMTIFYLNQKFTNTVLPTQLQMDIGKMASAKYQNLATLATYSFTHAMGVILYEQTLLNFSSKVGEIEFSFFLKKMQYTTIQHLGGCKRFMQHSQIWF